MRSQQAVILTYPAQFYLTKICINSMRKYIPECINILVLVDDTSELSWDTYYGDCEKLYSEPNLTLRAISTVNEVKFLEAYKFDPWIKQQIVKLLMGEFLNYDEIFFTDGDVIFRSEIPYGISAVTRSHNPVWYAGVDIYTTDILNLSDDIVKGVFKPDYTGKDVRFDPAVAPFRDIKLDELRTLKSYSMSQTNRDFVESHCKYVDDKLKFVSEWELIEAYKKHILKQELKVVTIYVHILTSGIDWKDISWPYLISTLYEAEKTLPDVFWEENGIEIDKSIWAKLPGIK